MLEYGYNAKEIQYLINQAINEKNVLAYNILRNYDTSHTGQGYFGYSMSNNAIDAYENGIKPISKWNSKDAKEFGALINANVKLKDLKTFLMRCGEKGYHHTSKYYNAITFYSLAEAMQDKSLLLKYFPEAKLENLGNNGNTPQTTLKASLESKKAQRKAELESKIAKRDLNVR